MKIWMFSYNNCLHNSRLLKEAKTLAEDGHDVKIVALLDEDIQPVEMRDGFQIVRLKKSHFHGPLSLFKYYHDGWQLLKSSPADVYHCHDLVTLMLGYSATKRYGGHLVYDAHELTTELAYLPCYQKMVLRILEKFLIKKVNTVIVPSQYRGEYLFKKYQIAFPDVTLNCPPLQHKHHPGKMLKEKLGLADDSVPVILYAGGFIAGRGLGNLIQAASHLKSGVMVFLGWGPLEQKLRDTVRRKGLDRKVFFLEPVPPDELVDYISPATLGVVIYQNTSLNNYYASPNKLYEYIHAGLPVVCSNFPALQEIVEKYKIGSSFDPETPESIAAAIDSVLSDKLQYTKVKENALAAAKIFNWETESEKLLGIYRRLNLHSDDRTT